MIIIISIAIIIIFIVIVIIAIMLLLLLLSGIPEWRVFKALYDLVEHDLPCGSKLSKLNTLCFVFLLKVRLNLHFDDIAFRFNVNKRTVCSHKPLSFSCTSRLNVIVIRNVY